jgi:signal transduction histidine kinase
VQDEKEDGVVKAGLILTQNITKQKNAELQMHQAIEQEKQLSEFKSNIVTTVSHQFRNPLTAITTSAETLHNYIHKLSKEKINKRLQNIISSADKMTNLMNEILVFSCIESGTLTFSPQLVNLSDFCHDLAQKQCEEMITLLDEERSSIAINTCGACDDAYIDPKLIDLALTNLVSNALKYSLPGGAVKLNIICSETDIIIQVVDEGIGISSEDRSRIFQPFFRSRDVENFKGTGFGLAIAKQAIQAHNGSIEVESELGKGSTFSIKFPFQKSP